MLSGANTHHRPVGCYQHPAGCRFIAFPATFYTIPRQKSSDSSSCGTVFQPLLGCQLQLHPCAGGASVPLDSWGPLADRRRNTWGSIPAGVSFGPCRGIRASRPPGEDVRCGRLRPYIHPRQIRRRRADSDRGGTRKRPAPVAVVRGHPEGKRRREPTRSKGSGICRKAGPGVNGREADIPPPSRSVLPAVPATQTVKPAACQDPLCP